MATLSTAARNAAVDAVVAHIESLGTPNISLQTSGALTVFNPTLSFPAASGGASVAVVPSTGAVDSGILAQANLNGGGSPEWIGFTIGATGSGEDIEISGSLTAAIGQILADLNVQIFMPAS